MYMTSSDDVISRDVPMYRYRYRYRQVSVIFEVSVSVSAQNRPIPPILSQISQNLRAPLNMLLLGWWWFNQQFLTGFVAFHDAISIVTMSFYRNLMVFDFDHWKVETQIFTCQVFKCFLRSLSSLHFFNHSQSEIVHWTIINQAWVVLVDESRDSAIAQAWLMMVQPTIL